MTITIAQHTGSDALGGTAQNPTITYASAQTAGNLNAIILIWGDQTTTTNSVTDTQGNAYSKLTSIPLSGGTYEIWYNLSIAAHAAGNVVTFNGSANYTAPEAWIIEAHTTTGSWSAGPTDHGSGRGTSMTSAGVTLTSAPTLGFAAGISGNGSRVTAGAGWTGLDVLSGADQDQWESFPSTGTATATATQGVSSNWDIFAGYFYTAASNAGFEDEGSSFRPWIHDARLAHILASGAEDVSVTPLKIDDTAPPPPPLFWTAREILASGLYLEDVAVTPLKIDDVGVPLPPLFDDGRHLLASAEEAVVNPLQIDDVGVPLPPLFGDGMSLLASAEEPEVVPLKVDETSFIPKTWWIDTPYLLASGDEFIALTTVPALDDSSPYPQPVYVDWVPFFSLSEEPKVSPLQIDETSPTPVTWWSDGFGLMATSDDSMVSTIALDDIGTLPSSIFFDWTMPFPVSEEFVSASLPQEEPFLILRLFSDPLIATPLFEEFTPSSALDEYSVTLPTLLPDATIPTLVFEEFAAASVVDDVGSPPQIVWSVDTLPKVVFDEVVVPSVAAALEEPGGIWLTLAPVFISPLPIFGDDAGFLQLAYVFMGPSSTLMPVFPPSLAIRPYVGALSVLTPVFQVSVISPPKRWP